MDPGILSTNNPEVKETLPAWSSMSHPTLPIHKLWDVKGHWKIFFTSLGNTGLHYRDPCIAWTQPQHWLTDGTSIGNERLAGQRHFTPLPWRSQNSTSVQWWERGRSGSLPLQEWITFVLQCRTWRRNVTQRPKNKEEQSSSGRRSSEEKSVYSKRQGIRRAGSQTGLSRACASWPFQMWRLQEEQLTRLKSCLLNSITFSPQPPKMHTTPSNTCEQLHSGKDQKSTNYLVLKYLHGSKSDEILMQKKKY